MRLEKIRVLIVDDSMLFREVLSKGISSDPRIEVVATANDPFEARDKIIEYRPDVMICDVEMPKMNGIDFIRRLMPQHPLPVIVVSTISSAVFDAMKAGAIDFVAKPNVQLAKDVEGFIQEIILKVKIAYTAKISNLEPKNNPNKIADGFDPNKSNRIIAIGASTGGTEAIFSILKSLPKTIPGIVIVQHIPPVFSGMFAERLDASTFLQVKEAQSGDWVETGGVLIAPGNQHMEIKKVAGKYKVRCFESDKVNGHCPSIDILFESVAREAGQDAIGIILTGMGYDGAKGLLSMRRKGARTIGQDEKSSVVYGMPKTAFNIGGVEKQASIDSIPQLIYTMLN